MAALTTRLDELRSESASLTSEAAALRREFAALSTATPSRADLATAIRNLEAETSQHEIHIKTLKRPVSNIISNANWDDSASGLPVTPEMAEAERVQREMEDDRAEHELAQWTRTEAARRKIWRDVRSLLREMMPLGTKFEDIAVSRYYA